MDLHEAGARSRIGKGDRQGSDTMTQGGWLRWKEWKRAIGCRGSSCRIRESLLRLAGRFDLGKLRQDREWRWKSDKSGKEGADDALCLPMDTLPVLWKEYIGLSLNTTAVPVGGC